MALDTVTIPIYLAVRSSNNRIMCLLGLLAPWRKAGLPLILNEESNSYCLKQLNSNIAILFPNVFHRFMTALVLASPDTFVSHAMSSLLYPLSWDIMLTYSMRSTCLQWHVLVGGVVWIRCKHLYGHDKSGRSAASVSRFSCLTLSWILHLSKKA